MILTGTWLSWKLLAYLNRGFTHLFWNSTRTANPIIPLCLWEMARGSERLCGRFKVKNATLNFHLYSHTFKDLGQLWHLFASKRVHLITIIVFICVLSYEQNTWLAGALSDSAGGIFPGSGVGQIPLRPKTCQCLPSPLLHNSHSDWALEPQRGENTCVTSKIGHVFSFANIVSVHTWQTLLPSLWADSTDRRGAERKMMQGDLKRSWSAVK